MIGNLGQVLEDMENGVYNFCKNGECSKCGACCSDVLPMTSKEIKEIKYYIKKHHIKTQNHLIPTTCIADLTCPFMDSSKECKCTIYEVRPKVCRDFICDPKQRPMPDINYSMKCVPIHVRETFFGK